MDQILEQVTPEQAHWLRKTDTDVSEKQGQLQYLRNQIDNERRAHESMLRDLRSQQSSSGGGGGGNGLLAVPSNPELLQKRRSSNR